MLGERVVAVGSCVVTAEARPEDADRLRRVMQWLPTYLGMYVGTLAKKSLRLKQRLLGIRDTLNDLRPTGVYNVSLFRSRRTTVGQSFSILRSLHPTYPVVVFCASSHTVHKLAPEPPFAQKKNQKKTSNNERTRRRRRRRLRDQRRISPIPPSHRPLPHPRAARGRATYGTHTSRQWRCCGGSAARSSPTAGTFSRESWESVRGAQGRADPDCTRGPRRRSSGRRRRILRPSLRTSCRT